MTFTNKLILTTTMLILLSMGILGFEQYSEAKKEIESSISNGMNDIITAVSDNVSNQMKNKLSIAKYITEIANTELTYQHIASILNKDNVKNSFNLAGGAFERDGKSISETANSTTTSNWDARTRPWYKQVKAKNKEIITTPYVDSETKETLVSIATPLKQDGNFIGALFFDLSVRNLSEAINKVDVFNAGYLVLVDGQGNIVTHPSNENVGKKINQVLPANILFNKPGTQTEIVGDTLFSYEFYKIDGIDWYLGVVLNNTIARQAVITMRNKSILFCGVSAFLSIFILFFVIRKLLTPLVDLNAALSGIAYGDGDLTQKLNTKTDKEFSDLAKNFNQFILKLKDQVSSLKEVTMEMNTYTDEARSNSIKAVSDVEGQFSELEQLSTSMNEMSATAMEVASNASSAAMATKEADAEAKEGVNLINETSSTIEKLSDQIEMTVGNVMKLEDAANNIDTVLHVISEIADQTNLLALNAAIEAARAGEQGRGFSVVADEVRRLAQRTQSSTSEIKILIDGLQNESLAMVTAMKNNQEVALETVSKAELAEKSLLQITSAINRITDMNLQIASAAEEQSLVTEEINTNTLKIRDISLQVKEDATATSNTMNKQTEKTKEQQEILNHFITD